jgi:primosomal protein DnaI
VESLSSLFKDKESRKLLAQSESNVRRVLNDPTIQKFKAKYPEISERTLKLNVNRLYQFTKEYYNCKNCPGLDQCPNDYQGHATRLTVEETQGEFYIHDHKIQCNKYTSKQAEDKLRKKIRCLYLDERIIAQGFSPMEIANLDPQRRGAVMNILEYIENTKKNGLQSDGLYLAGNFGTGKTYLMSYLLSELALEGYAGVIVFMPDFVEDLKRMFQDEQRMHETIELLKETDVLILDDLGAENLNAWFRDHVLVSILNHRMGRKPTFYTSNHDFQELERHLSYTKDGNEENKGKRIMERIKPYVQFIEVKGDNKRGRK